MFGVIVLAMVFTTGAVITIGIVGLQLRAKLKAIEVLKIYAERGEEPPAPLVEAVNQVGRPPPPPAPPPPHLRRGWYLSHFAGAAGLSLGGWGVVAWRALVSHRDPDWLMIVGLVVGIFFAAHAAARLTAALTFNGRG
jgi:hypothetical protein